MKRIAAVESFFSPEHRAAIEKAAAECGFSVDYFTQGHLPADQAANYEIIYGMCPPQELKAAANLKWLCCSFAGVDAYTDETIYPNPDVLLSNSSGAYGITISEHILMVTLMMLRQMPKFEEIVKNREWEKGLSMRSICGSSITVLGTGDIGTNFARRAKALGARSSGVCGGPRRREILPMTRCTLLRSWTAFCPRRKSSSWLCRPPRKPTTSSPGSALPCCRRTRMW